MEKFLFLNTKREGYTPRQCGETLTVGELIDILSNFQEDTPILLKNDDGYTFGSIWENDFEMGEK